MFLEGRLHLTPQSSTSFKSQITGKSAVFTPFSFPKGCKTRTFWDLSTFTLDARASAESQRWGHSPDPGGIPPTFPYGLSVPWQVRLGAYIYPKQICDRSLMIFCQPHYVKSTGSLSGYHPSWPPKFQIVYGFVTCFQFEHDRVGKKKEASREPTSSGNDRWPPAVWTCAKVSCA